MLGARRRWRSSIQLRVVTTTVLLSTVVILVVGQFLYTQISRGLLEARSQAVEREARDLVNDAVRQLNGSLVTDESSAALKITDVVKQIAGAESNSRGVLMRKAESSSDPSRPTIKAVDLSVQDITQDLRNGVNKGDDRLKLQKVRLTGPLPEGVSRPDAIIAGSLVHVPVVGYYELYIAFRMDREQEILEVVRRTFMLGGLGLVVLVAGVALMVTRQVVVPVKQAATTAEELASGRLDRRMRIRGSDEFARLGIAFNDMAGSLERQIHRLEALSTLQRRFVSDVSHELRTPLTTIRMASEVLYESRRDFDAAASRSTELLQAQLDRFEALLADLLEISRFDAGAAVLETEGQDVVEIVVRVVESLRPLAERSGTTIRLDHPLDGARAEIDGRRVERIVRNLLDNAIDHGEGRPIEVRIVGGARAVAVMVRDHGVGLRPGDADHVFDRFWRADPARARQTGGTGLGLAIALEDAHLHGGSLRAWGEPGAGATFVLTLPRRAGVRVDDVLVEEESGEVVEVSGDLVGTVVRPLTTEPTDVPEPDEADEADEAVEPVEADETDEPVEADEVHEVAEPVEPVEPAAPAEVAGRPGGSG